MKGSFSLKKLLPGIFLIGFNIGTGSVTAMSKAGADFGMSLLWALVLSCIFTFFMIHQFGKFTLVSGTTFIYALRKHIHPLLALFFLIAIGVNVSGSIMGVMGIVSSVLEEWSKDWLMGGLSSLSWAISITLFIIILFLIGNNTFFLKALSVMVGIMAFCFIVNALFMMPSLKDILLGLIPIIPEGNSASRSGFLVAASMVGTTLAPIVLVARSISVREEGWNNKDLAIQKKDALVSATLMFVISAAIIASAAGTLHKQGITLAHAKEMVNILKPVAGAFAVNIFVLGISAAGISSQFPNIFLVPWMICDFRGEKADIKSGILKLIAIGMAFLGIIVPLFNAQPVWIMVASQAFSSILLPLTVASIMYLCNSEKLMGQHRATKMQNLVFVIILIFSLVTCFFGILALKV